MLEIMSSNSPVPPNAELVQRGSGPQHMTLLEYHDYKASEDHARALPTVYVKCLCLYLARILVGLSKPQATRRTHISKNTNNGGSQL
jgi:hypothetical protein